jgi:hypothetical protein
MLRKLYLAALVVSDVLIFLWLGQLNFVLFCLPVVVIIVVAPIIYVLRQDRKFQKKKLEALYGGGADSTAERRKF